MVIGSSSANSGRNKERLIITAFFFLSGILSASWSSRIPDIQGKLGLNNATLGTVLFAIPAGLISGLTIASWLIATFGAKRILLISCITTSVLLVLIGLTSTTIQLMLVLFFLGFIRTIFNLSVNTSAVDLQTRYKQPIIASFHGIWSLACFVAAGIGTAMIIYDVRPLYHFIFIALFAAPVAFVLIRKRLQYSGTVEHRPFFVKPDKYLFLLGLIALSAMLCEGAMFDWSVNYFDKEVHAERSLITIGYIAFISAMAFGRLVGDRFIAAFGVFRMLMINGLLIACGFAIAALFPLVLPAAIGFLLVGIGDSILIPIVYMLAAKSKKMSSAYALSSVSLIGNTGFLIGPLFMGNVSEHWGMSTAFLLLSIVSLFIIFLAVQVRKLQQ